MRMHYMYIVGSKVISKGNVTVNKDTWYKLNLNIQVCTMYCKIHHIGNYIIIYYIVLYN